jgi:hypothetical protein
MRKLQLMTILGFFVVGAGLGMTLQGGAVEARAPEACANTYCEPGWATCPEKTGWHCYMSGGCAGAERCSPAGEG